MKTLNELEAADSVPVSSSGVDRRTFLKRAALAGTTGLIAFGGLTRWASVAQAAGGKTDSDTAQEIFTAALIAEGLATTMYYNALVGGVIQDPNLAGSGGTANNITDDGSLANVGYLQGALSEEITHANLLRALIGGSSPASDPVQTFYFPTGTFDNLENFLPILVALESAFIGAYLTAVEEFSLMAAHQKPFNGSQFDPSRKHYSKETLAYYAKVAASILGVEAQHLSLARAIPGISPGSTTFAGLDLFPADNQNYLQTAGLTAVYNGASSAVVALGPFVSSGAGSTAFSYADAIANAGGVSTPTTGDIPPSVEG